MTNPQPRSSAVSPLIDWSCVRSILLVRLRSIGDTVLMTACLDALKTWRPDIEIGVTIEPVAQPVVDGHPLVDKLFVVRSSLASRLALIRRLRRERFDVAFNLHGGTTGMFLTAMSGAGHTVGFRGQRTSWLLTHRAPAPDAILGRARIHSVEQQLALLNWTGLPMPHRPRLSLTHDGQAAARVRERLERLMPASVASRRLAVASPGAAFESKRWHARGFAALIDHLSDRWGLRSVVVAGPGQQTLAKTVLESCRSNPLVLSNLSLAELIALIGAFGRVFVGNDSGPMHIAAALQCPVVAVFGSSNPDVWHPWTDAPYEVLGGERGARDSDIRRSIDDVFVQQVVAAVDRVLQSADALAASR